MYRFLLSIAAIFIFGCSVSKQVAKQARALVLNDTANRNAHVGICIFEPSTGKYWYQHDADKFFVPASNTKLFSLFAGMKYLGDSLPGIGYFESSDTLYIDPKGDPTFLHPDFGYQPVFRFLKSKRKPIVINNSTWSANALGGGWTWDDFNESYMVERSPMPIYGNLITWTQVQEKNGILVFSEPDVNWKINMVADTGQKTFAVTRDRIENKYEIKFGKEKRRSIEVPFVTGGNQAVTELLADTLGLTVYSNSAAVKYRQINSVPSDSMYKIMMHRSDNFFAEQTLMMASAQKLGIINERRMMTYILRNDLKDLPQVPKWVDGSGLSRYNMFTPNDFVFLLNRMKNEFGLNRMEAILPTGGKGTLTQYYKKDSAFIYAKTGTLSNHVALSGYLHTRKNRVLIFSLLVNNTLSSATAVRRSFEKFLSGIRQHY